MSGWGNTRENFNPVHNYPPSQNPGGKGPTRKNLVKKLGHLNRNKNCVSMEPGGAAGGANSPMASICGSETPSSDATITKEDIKNNL